MRKLFYILAGLIVLAGVILLSFQRAGLPKTLDGLYAQYELRGHQAGIQSQFSGAVLVVRGEEVVFREAYGFADADQEEKLTVESRFLVGSNAKPMTALLVMQQVEAGVLDLEGTVVDYLPEFPAESCKRVTLHQLLSHTGGLPRDAREWADITLRHEPGSTYAFSNIGYNLLVAILEAATGKDYATLLNDGIVAPLGLKHTGFAEGAALEDEVADGIWFRKHEFPVAMFAPGEGSFTEAATPAAGAMYSSVDDLHRIVRAIRSNELLADTLTQRMLQPNLEGSAYGWFRNSQSLFQSNPGAPLYSHIGRLAGHNSVVAFYDDGTTVIVLSNIDPLDTIELLTHTHLAAHGTNETTTDLKHPSLNNPQAFRKAGGTEAFLKYYDDLSEQAGYAIPPSEGFCSQVVQLLIRDDSYDEAVEFADKAFAKWPPADDATLNEIGYVFLQHDRYAEARRYFELNVELYPETSNCYDSLGEAHEREGNLEFARENYTKALEIASRNNDRLAGFYERRLSSLGEEPDDRTVVITVPEAPEVPAP